jgi:hypothetical protein
MKLSFSELISKPNLSTFDHEIEGVGTVTITEISGAEGLDHLTETQGLANDGTTEQDHHNHIVKWAGRFLKGSMMDELEAKALSSQLSQSAIVDVYHAGLKVNRQAEDSKEELEKN